MDAFFLLPQQDQALLWTLKDQASKNHEALLAYLPPRRRHKLLTAWASLAEADLTFTDLLPTSLFEQTHPSWLLEMLQDQRLALLAVLLRQLPRAVVGSLLKDFSKEKRRELKAQAASRPLAWVPSVLSQLFQEKFPQIKFRALESVPLYKKIKSLSVSDIEKYFREVGLEEMLLAFSQMNRPSLKALLNRLSLQDAKELKKRLKKAPAFTAEDQRQAQLHLLKLDMEAMKPEEVVSQIGMSLFARSFAKGQRDLSQYFVYKLPKSYGLLLRRLVNIHSAEANAERVASTRKRLNKSYHKLFRRAVRISG